ncbi:MAG: Gfo/Idh/MocA family oxidoreductase [Verrucomicrobia bacterium]|nr:Gfo/Idh/MocA family oxidoreductase [Verrucomicrobiota bacterium]
MNTQAPLARRQFLQRSSAATAAAVAAPWLSRAAGANERINIGIIGTGGRNGALMGEILNLAAKHNVQVTAVCDVWKKNLHAAAARVQQKAGETPREFTRFQELLALKEVDAVVIATPDFAHGPMLVAALKAGKDVYIEKPMSIELAPANEALDLARTHKRVVQAGTQYRSDGKHRAAAKLLATGVLGQISRISVEMNFNQARWIRDFADCKEADVDWDAFLMGLPQRPFDARLLRQWQLFRFTSNGISGLWMSHYSDIVHLIMNAKYPADVVAHGGTYVWKDGREHTDTFHALLNYPEGFLFSWGMALGNSAGTHFSVHGTKGTMDMHKWIYSSEGGTGDKIPETKLEPEPGPTHMENWLQCLRTRQRPNADIQFGHQHAVATMMAAAALETGRRQKWDAAKREIVAG